MYTINKITPIKFKDVPKSRNRISQIIPTDNFIYLIEQLPEEGRNVIVEICLQTHKFKRLTPDGFSVSCKVYEYGGADYTVSNNTIYFVNAADQNIYLQTFSNEKPVPITFEKHYRYSDLVITKQGKYLICVRENRKLKKNIKHEIVAISLDRKKTTEKILLQGKDFYAHPRISADGKKFCYICWNHPQMPWDGSELWVSEIDENLNILTSKHVAGKETESITEPRWGPDDRLYFISDRNGWYNLYVCSKDGVSELFTFDADFSRPQWKLGYKSYTFISNNKIAILLTQNNKDFLGIFDFSTFEKLSLPWTDYQPFLQNIDDKLYFIAASYTEFPTLIELNLNNKHIKRIYTRPHYRITKQEISSPEEISCFNKKGLAIYAFFYPSKMVLNNKSLPPLIVNCHGGPTFSSTTGLNLEIQFWTSRGFAFVDVNYSGSAGYGRKYRDRIKGQWGIIDVEDCICITEYLINKRAINPKQVIIRGNSSGGFTALLAACFSKIFKCVVSYYGITDLEQLIKETHKFESHYVHQLIGNYQQNRLEYKHRSPINKLNNISTPILFIHGVQDTIVPYSQVQNIVKERLEKGLQCELLSLKDEGHSISKSNNIILALKKEYEFCCHVLETCNE